MPHSIKVNPGVPAIPDIRVDDRNLQQGYDALKEAVELLAGVRGNPNNRALTVGEATENGQTELFQTNITLANAAASQDSVRLAGDVAGTGLFDSNGAVVVPTALQLPNIIRIDGGAPGTNYASQPAGPYGIENVPTGGTTGQVLGKLSNADGDYDWITQTGGGGGGGGGAWTEIYDTPVTGSPTLIDITWDESLYNEIHVVYEGIQCSVNAISLQCAVGQTNGTIMHEGSGDYQGTQHEWTNTTLTAASRTDCILLARNTSSSVFQTVSGSLTLFGLAGGQGCGLWSVSHYRLNGGTLNCMDTRGFVDESANPGTIDTLRIYFGIPTNRRAFNNIGTIRAYGLAK